MTAAANIYANLLPIAFTGGVILNPVASPAAPTVTVVGTAGTTAYEYEITAVNKNGETLASAVTSITTGNATLSGTNYNQITWSPVDGADSYNVYGRISGSLGLLANVKTQTSGVWEYLDEGTASPGTAAPAANTTADVLKMGLLGSGYVPNLTGNIHWSDISVNEITGTGYTAGGATLTSPSLTLTAAGSWSLTWAANTTYPYGTIISPDTSNGYLYRQVAAGSGVSGATQPAFPTVEGAVVTDGSATWACVGDAALVFTSATVSWAAATFTASYAAIYVATAGGTEPLIMLQTFASAQSPSDQTFQVVPDPHLGWFVFSPPS